MKTSWADEGIRNVVAERCGLLNTHFSRLPPFEAGSLPRSPFGRTPEVCPSWTASSHPACPRRGQGPSLARPVGELSRSVPSWTASAHPACPRRGQGPSPLALLGELPRSVPSWTASSPPLRTPIAGSLTGHGKSGRGSRQAGLPDYPPTHQPGSPYSRQGLSLHCLAWGRSRVTNPPTRPPARTPPGRRCCCLRYVRTSTECCW